MPALVFLGLGVLELAACAEGALIVLLLVIAGLCFWNAVYWADRYEEARDAREEARATLATLRRMSEIRVETVTRMKGFGR